jgi:hypothetical protein
MANNRELLKEALADAKSLREMAIANAKAALEESFTPQIKTMLSEKLEEMEKEDMDEEMSKKYMEDDKMEEVEKEEMKEEKEEMEEDLNLDEILAELEESDALDEVESVTEVDEAVTEEVTEAEEMEGEMEMDMEEKDEPMELEDMSEEDLKSFIEGVIADMIEAGDLEAGEDMEGDDMEDEEVETEEEEEVNIDELLAEIESVDEEYKYEEDDKKSKMEEMSKTYDEDDSKMEEAEITEADLDEMYKSYEEDDKSMEEMYKKYGEETVKEILGFGKKGAGGTSFVKDFIKDNSMEIDKIMKMDDKKARLEAAKPLIMKFMKMNRAKMDPSAMRSDVSVLRNAVEVGELGGATKGTVSTMESIQKDLNEALEANKVLTEELNEVNLLNAKLLYTNRIFKSKNLTESQKVKVLSTFDKASTVNEVELVYETLNNTTFKSSKKSIKENLGSASRSVGTTKTTKPIIETNDAYKRMQELAFYNKKH